MATGRLSEQAVQETVDDVVSRGTGDWVHLPEVLCRVRENAARYDLTLSEDELLDAGLEIIRRVLDAGYMVAGRHPKGDTSFVPWDLDPAASYERIEREWREFENPGRIMVSEVCWLSNTLFGNEHGRAVLDEVNERFTWPPTKRS
jgi:hypothetical protein